MFPLRDDRPHYAPPLVNTAIITACALVFFYELFLPESFRNHFIETYGMIPAHLRPSSLLTSLFIHGGWLHIVGNMLFLWAFGRSLEDAMGHARYLLFYLLCGVAAGVVHVYFNSYSTLPTVGASGAIAGVMGAYLLKFPRARIHTLVFIIFFVTVMDIPAVFILVWWFFTQVFSGYGSIAHTHVTDSGVAWFAHIGGFVTGMILVEVMGTRRRYLPRRDIYW